MKNHFNSILEISTVFDTQSKCLDYLEKWIWNNKPVSPFRPESKVYSCGNHRYKCYSSNKYFNVLTGTIFENTKVPLVKWFMAIYLIASHKKGISSYQLGRDIGIGQKAAWFLLHRIRYAMDYGSLTKPLSGTIEADEVYTGGKVSNRHIEKRINKRLYKYESTSDRIAVFAMLERKGDVIAMNVGLNPNKELLQPIIKGYVSADSTIVTDGLPVYKGLNSTYKHEVVKHSQDEFVRGDYHTNSVEGFFSQFKRSIYGIYHQVSPEHLQAYVDETAYRYNTRLLKDTQRFDLTLSRVTGRRLTYKNLIANGTVKKRKEASQRQA